MSGLKDKAVDGMMWKAADKLGAKVIQFIIGIVIARLLSPDDFGIIGIMMFFISLSEIILESGFANALIQKQDRTDADYSTAFYFNIIVGSFLYACMWVAAPFIADFYDMPILCSVARVYSICFVLDSLTIVQTAKLSVDLNFKLQSVASLASIMLSSAVGVWMAYAGYGVWALVAQGVSAQFVRMLILWATSHWHPSAVFSVLSLKHLWGFGSKLLCSGLINATYNNLYALVIGKQFAPAEVGYFNRSSQFADLPTGTLTSVVTTVNYPILAQLQNDDAALRRAYTKCLRAPLFVLYPFLTFMAVLAEPMVLALIGEQWLPCVPILQILCVGAMWNPLTTVNLNLLYVKGRTDKVLKLEFIKKPIAFLILFSMIPFGLIWLCVGRSLYNFIAFCFNCYYTNKYIQLGFWRQLKSIAPIFFYCAVSAVTMLIVDGVLEFGSRLWTELVVVSAVGFISYIAMAVLFHDESLSDAVSMITDRLGKK